MEKKQLTMALFLAVLLSAICAVGCYTLFADDSKYENESDFNEEDSDEENEGDFDGGEEMTVYNGTCGDSATWTLDTSSKTLTISGTGAMYDYRSSNGQPWDSYKSYINTIIIGDGITTIGQQAFYGCRYATSITIPDSVISIGDGAFNTCKALTSITIPNSVTSIGESAFVFCNKLTSIDIPNGVTSIKHHTFSNCTALTSITIPNSVTLIENNAFQACNALTSITIPKNITSIGRSAFYGCSALTSITFLGGQPELNSDSFCLGTGSSNFAKTTIYSKGWASSSVFTKSIKGSYTTFTYVTVSFNPEIPVNVGGTWKTATPYVNVGGEWKEVTEAYVNVGGTWKEVGK